MTTVSAFQTWAPASRSCRSMIFGQAEIFSCIQYDLNLANICEQRHVSHFVKTHLVVETPVMKSATIEKTSAAAGVEVLIKKQLQFLQQVPLSLVCQPWTDSQANHECSVLTFLLFSAGLRNAGTRLELDFCITFTITSALGRKTSLNHSQDHL